MSASTDTAMRRTPSLRNNRPVNSGTTRIVKEYIKRVESHDLEEYPTWDLTVCLNVTYSLYSIYGVISILILAVVLMLQRY